LKPRWLGLFAIVVVVMVSFGMLGLWQLNVARDKGRAHEVSGAPTRPVADLATVLTPHGSFPHDGTGRRIRATGRYDGSAQVLVTPRLLAGKRGYWVVTPLVVRSTGARVAVVRGFVTDPAQAVAPEALTKLTEVTEVTVSGTLAPGESPAVDPRSSDPGDSALPDGQMATLDLSLLVNRWPGTLYNAFVFATAEQPDLTSASAPAVQRVPPPALVGGGLVWRNAAYAVQWWVFALFAGYMWWRMVRDDHDFDKHELDKHELNKHEGGDQEGRGSALLDEAGKARNV
jgi:surfeit locus 1 family protein